MSGLVGTLTRDTIASSRRILEAQWAASGPITVDLSGIEAVDSAGAALLASFARRARAAGREVRFVGLQEPVEQTLALFPFPAAPEVSTERPPGFFERLGEQAAEGLDFLGAAVMLAADVSWFTATGLFRRKGLRWSAVAFEMAQMGSRALGVVGLISFLVGATMALQSAAQLRQFGANIFVVDLVAVSITRELGPLITAIVVAGRSGSAVTAELATMTITEEIDALKTMGLNPIRFLVVPKVLAITLTQPLLTTLADTLAIAGGFLVAATYLGIGPETFVSRLEEALYLKDLLTGLIKSVAFAQLIVLIGAVVGLRTRGGADAVGRSTTTSVVAGIFAVIVADAVFSLLFYFQG